MSHERSRRQFLAQLGTLTAGAAVSSRSLLSTALGELEQSKSRVVIARDEALARGSLDAQRDLLRKLIDAAMQRVTDAADAAQAWRAVFAPGDRVGIKVNTLGLSTHPAVVGAIVEGLRDAGLPAEQIVIWDRFDVELAQAGFTLNKAAGGVQCRGTDAEQIGSGYQRKVESSGRIGSCFSRIVAEQVDALISVPVLKDHNLAGATLGLKNFYGAIHNPNKYHEHNCDPYIADVVSHRFIRPKWRLTVCDGTRAQCNGGPAYHPGYAWQFGGLIVSTDVVAADAVAANILDSERTSRRLKSLVDEERPPKHIATAAARGLGIADLDRIERVEL
ncbi:MAG: DUF362 domain-containing protein [Phycisphaerae bacterium]